MPHTQEYNANVVEQARSSDREVRLGRLAFCRAAADVPVADQTLIDPAKRARHTPQPFGAKDGLGFLSSGRMRLRPHARDVLTTSYERSGDADDVFL